VISDSKQSFLRGFSATVQPCYPVAVIQCAPPDPGIAAGLLCYPAKRVPLAPGRRDSLSGATAKTPALPRGGLGSQRLMLELHHIARLSIRAGIVLALGRDSDKS
jgi:hypothetical protein